MMALFHNIPVLAGCYVKNVGCPYDEPAFSMFPQYEIFMTLVHAIRIYPGTIPSNPPNCEAGHPLLGVLMCRAIFLCFLGHRLFPAFDGFSDH